MSLKIKSDKKTKILIALLAIAGIAGWTYFNMQPKTNSELSNKPITIKGGFRVGPCSYVEAGDGKNYIFNKELVNIHNGDYIEVTGTLDNSKPVKACVDASLLVVSSYKIIAAANYNPPEQ